MGAFDHYFGDKKAFTTDEIKLIIGERLKAVRKSNGIHMVDIEKEFDITRQTINNLEKGDGTLNSLIIYMQALGVTNDFIDLFFKDYQSREERLKNAEKFFKH